MISRGPYNVVLHGFGFMAVFTAFQTSGSFQTTVLKDVMDKPDLGNVSLAIIYVLFAFGNFVSPTIVHLLGARLSMVIAASGYGLFIASILTLNQPVILAASAWLGLSAAVLWTSQGSFLTANTRDDNRSVLSGVFWAQLQCSLLIGNLMLYFIVGGATVERETALLFYRILTGVAVGGILILCFTRKSEQEEKRKAGYQAVAKSGNKQGSVLTDSIQSDMGDTIEIIPANPAEEPASLGALELFVSVFKLMVEKNMLLLSFAIMYSGLELTFFSANYPTIIGDRFAPKDIGLSGICVGAGEILGGLVLGRLGKKYSLSLVAVIGLFFHAIAYFLIYINFESNIFTSPYLGLGLGISTLLGLGDSAFNTALYATLGTLYTTRSSQAFALFKFFQAGMAGIAFAYTSHVPLAYKLLILGVTLLLGTATFVHVDRKASRSQWISRSAYSEI